MYRLPVIFLLLWGVDAVTAPLHHALDIELNPAEGRLEATDRLTLGEGIARCFRLHPELTPRLEGSHTLRPAGRDAGLMRYCLPAIGERFTLHYTGRIDSPRLPADRMPIAADGVYLDPASGWYPRFDDTRLDFRLRVRLPSGWRGLTQGERVEQDDDGRKVSEVWQADQPQEWLFLIAARFEEYTASTGDTLAMVMLQQPALELAQRYLDATREYVDFYSRLLGPYPYAKFALVENSWDSGYGMPSFTLLGPRVIRLPFIIDTSYPHEILHNWWGNGVYVDPASGNWSEGLTTYLADHLLAERQGRGAGYRRDALQRYADYVHDGRGFALAGFRARHNEISQSVGYDKGLMLFHMLRRQLGDTAFLDGLRRFYAEHRFSRADFGELRQSMEAAGGQPLDGFFEQWVERSDAPRLALDEVSVETENEGYRLTAMLRQTQPGPPFRLHVPLAVQLSGRDRARETAVTMNGAEHRITLTLPARPERLAVDPAFDLMRQLAPNETPPSVSRLQGATRQLLVLPGAAAVEQRAMYRQFAAALAAHSGGEMIMDTALEALPDDTGVWLLGWDNRFRQTLLDALPADHVDTTDGSLQLAGEAVSLRTHGLVLVARHPTDVRQALGLIDAPDPATLAAMVDKLRHYGRYGYLVFRGPDAENILRGQWPVINSPLDRALGMDVPWRAGLTPRSALAP